MRIVIVGEYSSFSKNLSMGFRQLGHDCLVFSWGDVFKKIEPDDRTYLIKVGRFNFWGKSFRGSGFLKGAISGVKLHFFVKKQFKKEKADVVIVMNMAFLKESNNIFIPRFSNEMLFYMCNSVDRIYLSSCGNDYIVNKYLPLCRRPNEYLMFKHFSYIEKQKKVFDKHINYMRKVIPIAQDYALAYLHYKNEYNYSVLQVIPLPFAVETVTPENKVGDKIIIMHGVSRPYEKGSFIILSALERISKEFPDRVDVRVVRNLPLKDYLRVIHEANIVIDQCYGLSNGMNCIESLSMGKVVLSGNFNEYHAAYTEYECPVVNIEPCSEQIYNILKQLITDPEQIREISKKSRAFAEAVHDCKIVAGKYIEILKK